MLDLVGIGLVIVLYDHVITFDDEVQHVWKAKSSFAKWSFLFNRYLVPTVLIVVATCELLLLLKSSMLYITMTCSYEQFQQ